MLCAVAAWALASLAAGAHICNNGIHYYVEHSEMCPRDPKNETSEQLGCNLVDFARAMPFSQLFDRQVHWPGGVKGLDSFLYTQYKTRADHRTCLVHNMDACDAQGNIKYSNGQKGQCYGTTHEEFHIPDFCSRAMVSELSTVYNGQDRYTALSAGAKVLGSGTGPNSCGWMQTFHSKAGVIADVLQKNVLSKACWNQADDWRRLYCAKYSDCVCPQELTPEQCNRDLTKLKCCVDKYEEFSTSMYYNFNGSAQRKKCKDGTFTDAEYKTKCRPDFSNVRTVEAVGLGRIY